MSLTLEKQLEVSVWEGESVNESGEQGRVVEGELVVGPFFAFFAHCAKPVETLINKPFQCSACRLLNTGRIS